MIAYEELEKALARWKARRPETTAAPLPAEASEATSMGASEESLHGIPTGISEEDEPASDSTGELEIGDAVPADDGN